MRKRARGAVGGVLFGSALLLAAAQASAAPVVRFGGNRVIGEGFQQGRTVVIFGVATAPGPYFSRLLRYTQTLVADAAGGVTYDVPDGLPLRSVWFAVDAQTRDYAVASPHVALRSTLPQPTVQNGAGGFERLGIDAGVAEVLIVRPGGGVWGGSCGRNSRKDENRGNAVGGMRLSLQQMWPASGASVPPAQILPADLVVIVDSEKLSYYAGTAGRP